MLLHFWKFDHFRFTSHFVPVQSDESSWLFDGFRVKIHRHAWILTGSNPWTRIFLFRKVIFNQKLFYAFGLTGKLNFVFSCQLTAISNLDVTRPMIELLKHQQFGLCCSLRHTLSTEWKNPPPFCVWSRETAKWVASWRQLLERHENKQMPG